MGLLYYRRVLLAEVSGSQIVCLGSNDSSIYAHWMVLPSLVPVGPRNHQNLWIAGRLSWRQTRTRRSRCPVNSCLLNGDGKAAAVVF